jgi:hypothetical protein
MRRAASQTLECTPLNDRSGRGRIGKRRTGDGEVSYTVKDVQRVLLLRKGQRKRFKRPGAKRYGTLALE